MEEHHYLYYIFLEDQQNHPLSETAYQKLRTNIEKYYKEIKPPWPVTADTATE